MKMKLMFTALSLVGAAISSPNARADYRAYQLACYESGTYQSYSNAKQTRFQIPNQNFRARIVTDGNKVVSYQPTNEMAALLQFDASSFFKGEAQLWSYAFSQSLRFDIMMAKLTLINLNPNPALMTQVIAATKLDALANSVFPVWKYENCGDKSSGDYAVCGDSHNIIFTDDGLNESNRDVLALTSITLGSEQDGLRVKVGLRCRLDLLDR